MYGWCDQKRMSHVDQRLIRARFLTRLYLGLYMSFSSHHSSYVEKEKEK